MPGKRKPSAKGEKMPSRRASILIDKTLWVVANRLLIEEKLPSFKNFSDYMEHLLHADLKKRGEIK